jgi:hypothetical protein
MRSVGSKTTHFAGRNGQVGESPSLLRKPVETDRCSAKGRQLLSDAALYSASASRDIGSSFRMKWGLP